MDHSLLRSAIPGGSAERDHRGRILRKRRLLCPAGHRSVYLYPAERPAGAIRATRAQGPCPPVPLLCAPCDPGVGGSLERRRHQLSAGGDGLPHRVYALRGLLGGGDLQGPSVRIHRKGQRAVGGRHLQRHFWRGPSDQPVQRQRHGPDERFVPDMLRSRRGFSAGHDLLSRRKSVPLYHRPFSHQHPQHICQQWGPLHGDAAAPYRRSDTAERHLYPDP